MKKEFTCIVCPNGCSVTVEQIGEEYVFEGALCKRGEAYALQELSDPRRTIYTSVLIEGKEDQLLSVRLTKPIPLNRIEQAVEEIHKQKARLPVSAGDVLIHGILGEDSDVIAERSIAE